MAARFRVSTSEVRRKANELEGLNNQFKAEVTGLRDENQALGTKFEGDARNAFNNQFTQDMGKFDQFAQGIAKFVEQLRRDADEYDKAERANVDLANRRQA